MRNITLAFVFAAGGICFVPGLAVADATSPAPSSGGVTISSGSSSTAPASPASSGGVTITPTGSDSNGPAPASPAAPSNAASPAPPAKKSSGPAASKMPADASYDQRMNACSSDWSGTSASDRGTMSYRQFTSKCVSGKTALPANSTATCRDGSQASGAASGGACAENGGVAAWQQ